MKEEVVKRMQAYRDRTAGDFAKMVEAFKDAPEPKCDICGRVIYCGVNGLCDRVPCGLKGDKNETV